MSACAIVGCTKAASRVRQLCQAHLDKFYKYGDPLAGGTRAPNGSGCVSAQGYRRVSAGGVQRAEHVAIAERVLGKRLPKGALVHHVDEDKTNNVPSNLVICPSIAYHALLHMRMKARVACGNANWRKCMWCHEYDAPENVKETSGRAYHTACNRKNAAAVRARKAA